MKLIINTNNINNKEQLEFLLEKHLPVSFELYKKTANYMYYKGPDRQLVNSITLIGEILNKNIKYTIVQSFLSSRVTLETKNIEKDLDEDDKKYIKAFVDLFKEMTGDVKVNDEVLLWNGIIDDSQNIAPHLKEVLYVFDAGSKELSGLVLHKKIEKFQSEFQSKK